SKLEAVAAAQLTVLLSLCRPSILIISVFSIQVQAKHRRQVGSDPDRRRRRRWQWKIQSRFQIPDKYCPVVAVSRVLSSLCWTGQHGRGFDFYNLGTEGSEDGSGGGWNYTNSARSNQTGRSLLSGAEGGLPCKRFSKWQA